MIEVSVTDTFTRCYRKLPRSVRKKADVKTKLFITNPFYPSLRTKKLEPHREDIWSF